MIKITGRHLKGRELVNLLTIPIQIRLKQGFEMTRTLMYVWNVATNWHVGENFTGTGQGRTRLT